MIIEDFNKLSKLEISQYYHFQDSYHKDSFIIDFLNENAYFDPNYFESYKASEFIESRINKHSLYKMLHDRVFKKKISLNKKSINEFFRDMAEIDFSNQLNSNESLLGIESAYKVFLTFYFNNCEIEIPIVFKFPNFWKDFSAALEKLVGFDVLNFSNSKYWINNINYNLTKEGIFELNDNKKLVLKEFNFSFIVSVSVDSLKVNIDFLNNRMSVKKDFGFGHRDAWNFNDVNEIISENKISKFMELLIKNNVYLWSTEESWKYTFKHHKKFFICDGYRWSIELIFTNGAIFHIGGSNKYPDNYLEFARDIKELFGNDLFRIEEVKSYFEFKK